jgi:hypothetical protein
MLIVFIYVLNNWLMKMSLNQFLISYHMNLNLIRVLKN